MGCSNSKVSGPENFDERWNNKTGLCLALRFEAGEEKSLGLKCGIEKKGYHTKRERKRETPIPKDVVKDSALTEGTEGTAGPENEVERSEETAGCERSPQAPNEVRRLREPMVEGFDKEKRRS